MAVRRLEVGTPRLALRRNIPRPAALVGNQRELVGAADEGHEIRIGEDGTQAVARCQGWATGREREVSGRVYVVRRGKVGENHVSAVKLAWGVVKKRRGGGAEGGAFCGQSHVQATVHYIITHHCTFFGF